MYSWVDAHDGVVLVVYGYVAAERVHEVDAVFGEEFVGAGGVGEGAVVECADGADIGEVATHFREEHLLDVGVDFSSPAAAGGAEVEGTGDLLVETDAAGAVDAAVHVGYYQRTHVLVLDGSFVLIVAAGDVAVVVGVVL